MIHSAFVARHRQRRVPIAHFYVAVEVQAPARVDRHRSRPSTKEAHRYRLGRVDVKHVGLLAAVGVFPIQGEKVFVDEHVGFYLRVLGDHDRTRLGGLNGGGDEVHVVVRAARLQEAAFVQFARAARRARRRVLLPTLYLRSRVALDDRAKEVVGEEYAPAFLLVVVDFVRRRRFALSPIVAHALGGSEGRGGENARVAVKVADVVGVLLRHAVDVVVEGLHVVPIALKQGGVVLDHQRLTRRVFGARVGAHVDDGDFAFAIVIDDFAELEGD